MITGYLNLRKHLTNEHPATYDKAIVDNGWNYRFSSDVKSGKSNAIEPQTRSLPPFTQSSFIDHIIHFVVADDQVSDAFSESVMRSLSLSLTHVLITTQSIHLVECPEFRDLCMFLRPSLQDKEIPHRDRLREGIIEQWHQWFDGLRRELAVCTIPAFCFT